MHSDKPFQGVLTLNIDHSNGTVHVRTRIKDEWKIIWCPDEMPRDASGKLLRRTASIPISGIACDPYALMIDVDSGAAARFDYIFTYQEDYG
ncbi:MAG: hypothetical protein J7L98_02665 [Candidatus Verstraetearchaeota archaeon]|nr:hypothetical protein [Candidatus Verstraetearchaeota archaeon]